MGRRGEGERAGRGRSVRYPVITRRLGEGEEDSGAGAGTTEGRGRGRGEKFRAIVRETQRNKYI